MTNPFPNALSAEQLKLMFPDNEACAEDLFRRRLLDGSFARVPGNAVRLKRRASDGGLILDCAFRRRTLRSPAESPAPTRLNMLWLRTQSNGPLILYTVAIFFFGFWKSSAYILNNRGVST